MACINKKNKKILNGEKIRFKANISDMVHITYNDLNRIILGCTKEIVNYVPKYKVENTKVCDIRNFTITDEIRAIFIEIDKHNIPIVQFIKWLVQKDYIVKEEPKQEKKKYEHVEHDFINEKLITEDNLKSEISTSNCYNAFIKQVKITNTLDEIIVETNEILKTIKETVLKDKDQYTIYGNYTVSTEKLDIRSNNLTSFNINEILMMYRKLLMSVDNELRFKIVKNFRELMFVKAMTVYEENKDNKHLYTMALNDLLYIGKMRAYYCNLKHDKEIYKTIYPDKKDLVEDDFRLINHCMNIEYIRGKNIVSFDKYNFTYISHEEISKKGSEVLNWSVPMPKSPEIKRTKFQSGYIAPRNPSKSYHLDNEQLTRKKIVDYKVKQDYKKIKCIVSKVNDNRVLNLYCDSETQYILFDGEKVISKEKFKKLYDEMVEYITGKTAVEIERINKRTMYNGLAVESSIQKLLKYDLVLKTDLVTLQCNFENTTDEENIVVFVREDKKEHYNSDTLNHTYERRLNYYIHQETKKEISIIQYRKLDENEKSNYTNIDNISVKARIVYTKDIMESFFKYMKQWYLMNIDYTSNVQPLLTAWFHNLKFDILSTGILQNFEKYGLELNQFNNQIPRFFDFNFVDEVCLKSRTRKPKLFFIDSFNFSPTNLEKMGKTIGIRKPKELVDFNLNTNLIVDKDCLTYAVMDVVILKEFINDFKKHILDYACLKYGTAGTAQNVFLSAFYGEAKYLDNNDNAHSDIDLITRSIKKHTDFKDVDKYIDGNYDKAFIHEYVKTLDTNTKKRVQDQDQEYKSKLRKVDTRIHLHRNPYIESLEMSSYFGGRTEVFNYTGLMKYVQSVDINSSYPSSMLKYLPTQYKYSIINPSEKQIDKILNDKNLYGLFNVYIKEDKNRIVPMYYENRIINPYINDLSTPIHEPEFKLLYEKNKSIVINEIHVYSATNLLFADYINKWSFEKSYNKQEFIKNEVLVSISKLLMNSTYGKFGEKIRLSECRKLDQEELYFFSKLISITKNELVKPEELGKIVYNYDLTADENMLVDIDYDIKKYFKVQRIPIFEVANDLFEHELIQKITKNVVRENIRLTFFAGHLSYNKKVDIPANSSSFILVGAITSYSRSALYQGINKIGFENTFYGDTDSLYYDSDIKDVFDEIKLNNVDLDNPENYRKVIEKVNEIAKKKPNKIHLVKSLISELHFWEKEYKEPYDIVVRGNKDNIKIFYIDFDNVFVIGRDGTKEDYLNYAYHRETKNKLHVNEYYKLTEDIQEEYIIYKYCINESNIAKFKKSIKKRKYFYCKLSEKHKGVSLRALLLNQDLYLIEEWLSIAMQRNRFGDLDGQYITYKLKSLYESRTNYQKSECISSKKKSVDFIVVNQLNDEYNNPINNKFVLDYEVKYKYVEQKLKPLTVTYDSSMNRLIKNSSITKAV